MSLRLFSRFFASFTVFDSDFQLLSKRKCSHRKSCKKYPQCWLAVDVNLKQHMSCALQGFRVLEMLSDDSNFKRIVRNELIAVDWFDVRLQKVIDVSTPTILMLLSYDPQVFIVSSFSRVAQSVSYPRYWQRFAPLSITFVSFHNQTFYCLPIVRRRKNTLDSW